MMQYGCLSVRNKTCTGDDNLCSEHSPKSPDASDVMSTGWVHARQATCGGITAKSCPRYSNPKPQLAAQSQHSSRLPEIQTTNLAKPAEGLELSTSIPIRSAY